MTKETLTRRLLSRLDKFNGRAWNRRLEKEVRHEVLIFLAEHNLYPRHLGIAIDDDGFIEIDCNDYTTIDKAN